MDSEAVRNNIQARADVAAAARRRLVAHLTAGATTDLAPDGMTQPAQVYTDPDRFQRERRMIFDQWPLIAGLSGDLAEPGDVLVFEEMGYSILLVRDQQRHVQAFLNTCAHRGTRLVDTAKQGVRLHRSRLSCPFHGWCYALDGKLIAVPGTEGFDPAELARRGLIKVPVAEWQGLLLVRLKGASTLPAEPYLGTIAAPLAQLDLGALRHVQSSSLTAQCNWKLAVDTYAENYHFGVLHGASIGDAYISNVAVFDSFGPHWRAHFPERSLMALVGQPEAQWPAPVFKAVHFLFPNTVLVVGLAGPGRMMVRLYRIFPGASVGTAICRMSVYSDANKDELPAGAFADESSSVVTREDYTVAESIQANLEVVPPDFSVVYGRNEIGVQAFHAAVAATLGETIRAD